MRAWGLRYCALLRHLMTRAFVVFAVLTLILSAASPAAALPVANLHQTEQSIMGLPYEVAVVINRYGREARRFIGVQTETTVAIDWRWSNGVMTHNHPCPAFPSVSIPDIEAGIIGNVREVRAVSTCIGYPMVCRAWRIGAHWQRFKNIAAERAQLHALVDFKPYPLQAALMQWYMSGLAVRYKFGFECRRWQ